MNDEEVYEARLELIDFGIAAFWDVPEADFLEGLLSGEAMVPEESVNAPMDEGFEMLEAWIDENRGRPVEEVREELNTEYTRLFIGPRPPVLPHESHYREDTDFLGEGLAAVTESYRGAGWEPPEDYEEEDDFIAVELAFLRHLVDRQRAGHAEAFAFERVFIEEHMSEWVDAFLESVRDHADPGLFLAAALVVRGLVQFEDEIVAQIA
ncbi:MAG: molecular chaperone TorD family protein [Haloarculaceae archaeon]